MNYKIITHDGKPHMDELIASSLLALYLKELPQSIDRIDSRDASAAAVAAADTGAGESANEKPVKEYYLDCGLIYDPEKGFFDHHQERDMDSAALLVFDQYFTDLLDTDLHSYIKLLSKADTKGPMSLQGFSRSGESSDYLVQSLSLLLSSFEIDPLTTVSLVSRALEKRIDFEELRKEAALWMKEGHLKIVETGGAKALLYCTPPPPHLSSALKAETKDLIEGESVDVTVGFDKEDSEIRTLYRTDHGHDRIDFTRSEPKEPLFVHKGGFYMKFRTGSPQEWKEMVIQAFKE